MGLEKEFDEKLKDGQSSEWLFNEMSTRALCRIADRIGAVMGENFEGTERVINTRNLR